MGFQPFFARGPLN